MSRNLKNSCVEKAQWKMLENISEPIQGGISFHEDVSFQLYFLMFQKKKEKVKTNCS